jgi:hypothetical protein
MNPDKDHKQQSQPEPGRGSKGSGQQQQSGTGQQYGEGSYSGTRQYNEGVKEHMQHHDIEREARDAEPRTAAEEKDMEKAERIGRSKSRGEGASPDGETGEDTNDLDKDDEAPSPSP